MSSLFLTLAFLFVSFAPFAVQGSPCIAMDSTFNLLAFGINGKDYDAGQQSSWTSSTPATEITASGRPPFDGTNTTCYLSQFLNAVYVLSGDTANPTSVYIYDVGTKSWSQQAVSTASSSGHTFDPTDFTTILDHDTNVFYALSGGETFFLDMQQITEGNTTTSLPWVDVGQPSFTVQDYQPVMAIAQNHVHFLNVPGSQAGEAYIFVIHFSFFQPTPQSYPASGGQNFPVAHGQATSFFQTTGVQQEFAFIPDDGSATYVVNVETNTTQVLAGPSTKDSGATYFAGITSLVQLTSSGQIAFLPYTEGDASTNSQATWTTLSSVPTPTPGSSSSSSGPSATGSNTVGSGSSTSSGSTPSTIGSSNTSSASHSEVDFRMVVGLTLLVGFAMALFS